MEFVGRHQAAILHDLVDGTFRAAIIKLDDALYALWRGKWQLKAAHRVSAQLQEVWFAVVAAPEISESAEARNLATEFAKDGGVLFTQLEAFPPGIVQEMEDVQKALQQFPLKQL